MGTESLPSGDPLPWGVYFYPLTGVVIAALIVLALLVVFMVLISASEVVYFSLSKTDKQKLTNSPRDQKLLQNLGSPAKLLSAILIANSFLKVGIVILCAYLLESLFGLSGSPLSEFVVKVVVITFLLLFFGEILPRVFAARHPLLLARLMAFPLSALGILFSPLNAVLLHASALVNRRFRKGESEISMNDITHALELTSDNERSDEKEILEGIVRFGNKSVSEIMRPRVDVVSIDIRSDFSTVLDVIDKTGYSRLPVYSESFDNVKGILFIKDLLPHTEKGPGFNWQSLLRLPFYVPEARKIKALLEDFQKNKVHMAIVVDEYGGTSGIVTLEDVLEEIVGDIADEFDEDEQFYTRISDKKYLFDGKTPLLDFCRVTDSDEDIFEGVKGDADTLAGLILELKGEFPALNEKISCRHFTFSIEAITNRRIKQVRVEIG